MSKVRSLESITIKGKNQVIEFSGGYNLLMLKAEEGDFDEVRKLLSDAKSFDVNAQNKNGYTALSLATKGGFYEIVQTLINVGANVNINNNVISKNPIHPSSQARLPSS